MKTSDQVLVLLSSEADWSPVAELRNWVEYSSASMFKARVLKPLHSQRLIEHDAKASRVRITPRGVRHVEDQLLPRSHA